jgi:hypothetical protein
MEISCQCLIVEGKNATKTLMRWFGVRIDFPHIVNFYHSYIHTKKTFDELTKVAFKSTKVLRDFQATNVLLI